MNPHRLAQALRLLLDSLGAEAADQVEVVALAPDHSGVPRFSATGRAALSAACSTFGAQTGLRWSVRFLGGVEAPQSAVVCVEADQAPPKAREALELAGAPFDVPVVPVLSVELSSVPGRRFVVCSEQPGRPEIGAADNVLLAMAAALELDDVAADLLGRMPAAGGMH